MKNISIIFFLFFIPYSIIAQSKIVSDTLNVDNIEFKTIYLPKQIDEISALEYEDRDKTNDTYWGLNDSGNATELYRFTEEGNIIQTIKINNAPNIDWEEISMDSDRLYFADFGNNLGKRKDLSIYYIYRDSINLNEPYLSLNANKIEFYYPEQKEFEFKNLTTNWDAEAFFIYNDKIHILTKEWNNKATTHYTVPIDNSKKHAAKKIETFDTNYLITGAYLSTKPTNKGLYLVGYTKDTFAFLQWFDLPKNNTDKIFTKSKKITTIPLGFTTQLGQLEGISLSSENKNQICISGEEFKYKNFYAKQVLHCFTNFTTQK